MNKKIVAGALLGALSLGVGLSVIPETIYQEPVQTKQVGNLKRAASNNETYILANEKIGKIGDFTISKAFSSSTGLITEKVVLQKGYYAVADKCGLTADVNNIDKMPQKAYFDADSVIFVNDICVNSNDIVNRLIELNAEFFFGMYACVIYSDGVNPTYIWNNFVEDTSHLGNLIKYDLVKEDKIRPTITGTNNFVVNVNNMLTKEQILSHITAKDDTDGQLPVVIDSTDYDPLNKKTGDYNMVVSATDKAGNKTSVTISIKVVDVDKPVISGTANYSRSYDNPISLDSIKQGLTVSDKYDKNLNLELVSDNYSNNKNKVGNYEVKFKTTDSSNNVSNVFTVTINVHDKIKPVLTGPSTINVPSNTLLKLEELIAKYTANDAYDGSITIDNTMITGYSEYQNNFRKVGSYPITISVTDKNGNNSKLSVNIIVEDKISPEIFFDNYFIVLQQGQSLTAEQIKEYAAKALGVSVDAITEVKGEYDTNTVGTFRLSVKLVTGEEKTVSLTVDAVPTQYKERAMKWYEYLYKWVTVLFNIEDGYYHTDSFFNFGTRCKKIGELYSTGIYKELIK